MSRDYPSRFGGAAIGARLRRLSDRIDREADGLYSALGIDFEQRWFGVMIGGCEHSHERSSCDRSVLPRRRQSDSGGIAGARLNYRDGRSGRCAAARTDVERDRAQNGEATRSALGCTERRCARSRSRSWARGGRVGTPWGALDKRSLAARVRAKLDAQKETGQKKTGGR
jgi:hypothetical protein